MHTHRPDSPLDREREASQRLCGTSAWSFRAVLRLFLGRVRVHTGRREDAGCSAAQGEEERNAVKRRRGSALRSMRSVETEAGGTPKQIAEDKRPLGLASGTQVGEAEGRRTDWQAASKRKVHSATSTHSGGRGAAQLHSDRHIQTPSTAVASSCGQKPSGHRFPRCEASGQR